MATLPPAGRLVSWLSIAKIRCFRRFVVTHKTLDAIVFESS
jgi:mRNA-degrading endonuclease HigB of HigAB toxin-antitoxin module